MITPPVSVRIVRTLREAHLHNSGDTLALSALDGVALYFQTTNLGDRDAFLRLAGKAYDLQRERAAG